jgi:uncharacterized protein YjbI with pentapeptide repeats
VKSIEEISYKELLDRYASGERDFSNCRFWGDNELIGSNLQDAIFIRADWAEHDLSGANLTNANLTGTNFSQANLSEVNLTNANLTDAYLDEADLTFANLTNANLTNVRDLERANFFGTNLTNTNLNNIDPRPPHILRNAIFSNTIMPDGSIRNESVS